MADARTGAREAGGFYLAGLDGLRALAFAIVFLSHAFPGARIPGGFGVTIFFFLSGYLITTLLRMERAATGRIDLGAFYLRRALRILPPMYLALFGALAISLALGAPVAGSAVLAQALHGSNYHSIVTGAEGQPLGTHVLWSLAIEEHFYLVFPLGYLGLARIVRSVERQAAVVLALCALTLVWRCVLVLQLDAAPDRIAFATDTRFDSILLGSVLALWRNPALPGPSPSGRTSALVVPLALAALVASIAARGDGFRETVRYTVQGLALAPIFVAVIRWPQHPLVRPLTWSWVGRIGVYSYVLYLVHHTVLLALRARIADHALATAVLGLAISLLIAALVHQLVERPAAGLRRRLRRQSAEPRRG